VRTALADAQHALTAIRSWPVPHAAAGAAWAGAAETAVEGEADRPFALASVTKVLSALAVLVAVEEAVVDLDEPAGPPGSTVRHFLAHASGLGPEAGDPAVGAPGERRAYSNAGFEVLADLVAERAGLAFDRYLAEAVCEPLAMGATRLEGSAAHGATSTVADLLRLAEELLSPGRVIHPDTLRLATTAAFPDLAGVLPGFGAMSPNPWGLGVELRGSKHPHWTPPEASPGTFGHFGRAGTMLWVDPAAGVACVALTDREFGPWAASAWPELGSALLRAVGG
jgi:CubicO group peptidase (beta-lactamase class C family)